MRGPEPTPQRRTGASRHCRWLPGAGEDAGVTLVEVVVAMSLMTSLLAIFTAGIVALHRSANHSEGMVVAQSQIHLAFERLDTQIRYASSISAEARPAGSNDWYVEYLTAVTGVPVCEQLRLTAGGLLQQRGWVRGDTPPGFATLASGVSSPHPFTRQPAGTDRYGVDRLVVNVSARSNPNARQREINVAFAALNSSPATSDATVCTEGRPS